MVVVEDTTAYKKKIRRNKARRFEKAVVRYRRKPVVKHIVKAEKVSEADDVTRLSSTGRRR